jgi:hypothetical protein
MKLRDAIRWLLGAVVALPLLQALLYWVGGLLTAMGDAAAARVLKALFVMAGVAWLASLVGLVVVLAILHADDPRPPGEES